MRKDPDHFGEQDLALIYIARRLKEALKVEKILSDAGFDYLVEPDTYSGGFIFHSERIGAFFYVAPGDERAVRDLLGNHGYRTYQAGA